MMKSSRSYSSQAYSLDLRDRVIDHLKRGGTYESAAKIFQVSVSAIGRWYRRYKALGHYQPKQAPGAKRKVDPETLARYVESNPEAQLKQMAQVFQVSMCAIHKWLKRLGFVYKKNLSLWRRE